MFYDAEPERSREYQEAVRNGIDLVQQKQKDDKTWPPPIELKLVDFANCVTAEDEWPHMASAPPRHPHDIDRGYLRGLRTLKAYFTQILKDIKIGDYVERGECDDVTFAGKASSHPHHGPAVSPVPETDDGDVSF